MDNLQEVANEILQSMRGLDYKYLKNPTLRFYVESYAETFLKNPLTLAEVKKVADIIEKHSTFLTDEWETINYCELHIPEEL